MRFRKSTTTLAELLARGEAIMAAEAARPEVAKAVEALDRSAAMADLSSLAKEIRTKVALRDAIESEPSEVAVAKMMAALHSPDESVRAAARNLQNEINGRLQIEGWREADALGVERRSRRERRREGHGE